MRYDLRTDGLEYLIPMNPPNTRDPNRFLPPDVRTLDNEPIALDPKGGLDFPKPRTTGCLVPFVLTLTTFGSLYYILSSTILSTQ